MPLTSRGYPYPAPADPANVPADIQALATAMDTDQANLCPAGVTSFGDWQHLAIVGASVSTVGNANRALTVAFRVEQELTPGIFAWWCTTQSGNYDVGIINFTTRALLWSLGLTACPATGHVGVPIVGGPTLVPGVDYGMTFAADNNTLALRALTWANFFMPRRYNGTSGVVYSAAACPLPNPLPAFTDGSVMPAMALRA